MPLTKYPSAITFSIGEKVRLQRGVDVIVTDIAESPEDLCVGAPVVDGWDFVDPEGVLKDLVVFPNWEVTEVLEK